MKRLPLLIAATVAALAATSTGAGASSPTTVSPFSCVFEFGGQVTVPAGTVIFGGDHGWATPNRGQVQNFLNAVTVTASIDGTPIANANSYFSPPQPLIPAMPPFYWITNWTYPTEISIAAGQSVIFTEDWVTSHPLSNARVVPGPPVPAGSQLGGPITCTVTGT